MDTKTKKSLGLWVVILVVVILVLWSFAKKSSENNQMSNISVSPTPTASPTPTGTQSVKQSGSLTYEQALQQYSSARIQFNDTCQANSTVQSIKNGTKMLLDNRSKYSQTIKLGSSTYSLPALGWRIVTVSSKTLPYDMGISCSSKNGSTVNSAVIKLQANILQGI